MWLQRVLGEHILTCKAARRRCRRARACSVLRPLLTRRRSSRKCQISRRTTGAPRAPCLERIARTIAWEGAPRGQGVGRVRRQEDRVVGTSGSSPAGRTWCHRRGFSRLLSAFGDAQSDGSVASAHLCTFLVVADVGLAQAPLAHESERSRFRIAGFCANDWMCAATQSWAERHRAGEPGTRKY